jgi:methionine-rich copper-binding protein CopC
MEISMTIRDEKKRSIRARSLSDRVRNSSSAHRHTIETLESRTLLAALTITQENQLPGTPPSQWYISSDGDTSIQGYATDMSVDQGGRVNFKVNDTSLAPYRLDIYRMGYYQGHGARKVATVPSSETIKVSQPAPLTDSTGLVDAGNWSVTASWSVPADATSGIYFANVVREDTGGLSQIIFIVRDDDGRSDMLFQTADATWQAYNGWGGKSMYVGGGQKVSYNRPFATRSYTPMGRDFVFGPEFAMVRFLEANGYDVSYFTNVDTARFGQEIKEHKVFLSVGHDEYWSGEMRGAAEAARDSGVHLAFFSGNEVYWKTRWENAISPDGTPLRTMVAYKETKANAKIDPSPLWTGTWRDPRFSPPSDGGRPENALTGQLFTVNRGPGGETGTPFNVPADFAGLRFWRNTSVANLGPGQVATLGDIVLGYEWDEDIDNGFRPAGLIRMSSTTQNVPQKLQDFGSVVAPDVATHTLTLYRASSGALVFGAGTVQWSYGLDGTHDGPQTTPDPAMRQATVNLFADMGVQPATLQPGLLRATASTDVTPPTSTISGPASGTTVVAGGAITITGTAADTGGGIVGGVEVSTNGGVTWHRAVGRNTWTYTWVPSAIGPTTVLSRAADDSGNFESATSSVPVNVTPQPTSTAGLVGAWNFNAGSGATAADSSGGGNNGTLNGATWSTGFFGGGLTFDGVNDLVTVNDSATLDLTNGMTLEAWVKPTSAGTWRSVIMKERSAGLAYALYASNDAGSPESFVSIASDKSAAATVAIPVNAWSHLATTFDGSLLKLIVNGTVVATRSAVGNITTSAGLLSFGGNSIWGEYFQGVIDEVRIYSRPLTEGEIRVDMSTSIGYALEASPPTASMSSPASGTSVSGDTTLTASAFDNVGVAQVEFLRNGVLLGSPDTTRPFTVLWRTAQFANGAYTITARSRDFAGNTVTSAPITLNVNNPADVTLPTVVIKNPLAGSRVSGSIPVWVTAADNIGVLGVQFQIDGANVGAEDTTAPYQFVLNTKTLADGSHTLAAVARDAAGNLSVLAPVTFVVDNTPPTVTQAPAPGATEVPTTDAVRLTFNESVDPSTILVEVRHPNAQLVAGSMSYDAATRVATFTPSTALSVAATYTVTLRAASDLAGNNIPSEVAWSFTTISLVSNVTIWDPSTTPTGIADTDAAAVEVGLRFRSEINGYITGVRFYKAAANTGTHVGRLWTNDGVLLGSVTFANETASGWQQANFDSPLAVTQGVTYVVTYHAPVGRYAVSAGYFTSAGYDGGVLEALANGVSGGNGVYRYGAGGVFPTSSNGAANYWVDAVFSNTLVDAAPPVVTTRSPASAATNVDIAGNVTASFSEALAPGTLSFVLRDAGGAIIPASVSYDAATFTATLDPSATLAYNTTYTATVSGATDANGNVMASTSWSFTTAVGPDLVAPSVVSRSPAAGAANVLLGSNVAATFDESIDPSNLVFELRNASNQLVTATVTYNAATRTATLDPAATLGYSSSYIASVRAQDPSGNLMASAVTWSFTTEAPIIGATIWPSTVIPATLAANDTAAVEVGVKFRASADGYITGIRFYKGTGNGGTHVGRLWSSTGTLVATVTFIDETATGWQQADFSNPVAITGGQTYVASYYAPVGRYSTNAAYFATSGTTSGPLTALGNGVDGGNGVYMYGAGGGFPTSAFNSSNYWVDVVYSNTLPADVTPPAVVSRSPLPGEVNVLQGASVTVKFSESVVPGTSSFVLRDASNNVVTGVVSYNESTRTVTFNPSGPLVGNATYTATLQGATDAAGNVMSVETWSFTVAPPIVGATIWPGSATPTVAAYNDTRAVEVGVKFRASADGYITGIRFYKGTGNGGTHVGHLWSSTGTLVETVTFTDETATGWQQADFSNPVAIAGGETYVASYYAPVGRYSTSNGYFAADTTSGPLTALGNDVQGGNGVFTYAVGGAFPTSTFNATNYWVDVVYASTPNDLTPPTVTRTTPANGATLVLIGSNISATFKEAVDEHTISMVLRDAANNIVPASVTYDAATHTATLDPGAPLVRNATYTVTLSSTQDAAGNVMAPVSWSFSTEVPVIGATVWSNTATPATLAANDTQAVEVGVKFRSSLDGYITGIRFYKGTGNTGTHLGHLWSSTGTLLATVTFTGETDTGWQQANFSTPVAIVAGQTYIASYYAPVGRYSVNTKYFASTGTTTGPLTVLRNGVDGGNGVYRYGVGGGFPTLTSSSSNYWVDVVFSTVIS